MASRYCPVCKTRTDLPRCPRDGVPTEPGGESTPLRAPPGPDLNDEPPTMEIAQNSLRDRLASQARLPDLAPGAPLDGPLSMPTARPSPAAPARQSGGLLRQSAALPAAPERAGAPAAAAGSLAGSEALPGAASPRARGDSGGLPAAARTEELAPLGQIPAQDPLAVVPGSGGRPPSGAIPGPAPAARATRLPARPVGPGIGRPAPPLGEARKRTRPPSGGLAPSPVAATAPARTGKGGLGRYLLLGFGLLLLAGIGAGGVVVWRYVASPAAPGQIRPEPALPDPAEPPEARPLAPTADAGPSEPDAGEDASADAADTSEEPDVGRRKRRRVIEIEPPPPPIVGPRVQPPSFD